MNEIITSLKNPKILHLKKCLNSHYAIKNNCFLLTDLKLIKEAYERHLVKQIYTYEPCAIATNVCVVSKGIFIKLNITSSIIAIISLLKSDNQYSDKVIYLDEISNPTNLGKIIYLMHKYHYRDLILSPNTVSLYNKKCLEIAQDYIFDISVHYGDINTLKELKKNNYQIISTGLKSATFLSDIVVNRPYILIFGNEARGVKSDILTLSDQVIRIDIRNIDSLNVATAIAIILENIKI